MASKLSVGDWALIDGYTDQDQPVWCGRVMSNRPWDMQVVKANKTVDLMHFYRCFIKNDYVAINIQ